MRQIVGEVLTISAERVAIESIGTSATNRDGGGGGGSKTTHTAGNVTLRAAQLLRAKLLTLAAEKLGCQEQELDLAGGAFVYRGRARTLAELAREAPTDARTAFVDEFIEEAHITSFCTQGAEVEVDPETGEVKVLQLVSVHDVGTIINPLLHQGQIDGAVIQGLGYGVIEEMHLEEGRVISTTFAEHKIPCIKDVPVLKTVCLEPQPGEGPLKAQAIGEHPISGIAPAIANAVQDAIGVRVTSLPITAEKVYHALHQTPTQ
jgi:CO/xanthine dehydrogenase Mo-binding subunit